MRHLTIQNFGLIKEVDIELKRVTILIGSEFSDKTLVLKVAYFCDWLECQIALSQDPQNIKKSDVATQSGFSSERSFYRNFKKFTGKKPMEWANTITASIP